MILVNVRTAEAGILRPCLVGWPQNDGLGTREKRAAAFRIAGFSLPIRNFSCRTTYTCETDGPHRGGTKMPDEEWVKKLDDGKKVKFVYQELPEDGAFITAQVEGNEVVYSVLLRRAGNPLSREDVERHFKAELSKK